MRCSSTDNDNRPTTLLSNAGSMLNHVKHGRFQVCQAASAWRHPESIGFISRNFGCQARHPLQSSDGVVYPVEDKAKISVDSMDEQFTLHWDISDANNTAAAWTSFKITPSYHLIAPRLSRPFGDFGLIGQLALIIVRQPNRIPLPNCFFFL